MTTFESGGLGGGAMGKSTGAPVLQRMTETPKLRQGVPADYRRDFGLHKRVCGGSYPSQGDIPSNMRHIALSAKVKPLLPIQAELHEQENLPLPWHHLPRAASRSRIRPSNCVRRGISTPAAVARFRGSSQIGATSTSRPSTKSIMLDVR